MDSTQWNSLILNLPGAHILQSWEWGSIKEKFGWRYFPQTWQDDSGSSTSAAMILQRTIPTGGFTARLRILYVPRGPLLDWTDPLKRKIALNGLQAFAKKQRAIFIKIDPEVLQGTGIPGEPDAHEDENGHQVVSELQQRGWRYSDEQIQFNNTVWIDLSSSEDEWLARMKQKARYNLRLAQKKGVNIRLGTPSDLSTLYQMYAETSVRDSFVIRPENYYQAVWRTFMDKKLAHPLIAEVNGEIIAGLFLFHFGSSSWYLYGMSRQAHREKMPNYLLQWEAMRLARSFNCTRYDLWGAPSVFNDTDPMWGVFRFKEGWGGTVIRTIGAWDFPVSPTLYTLYTRLLPKVLSFMRHSGKERVKKQVSPSL